MCTYNFNKFYLMKIFVRKVDVPNHYEIQGLKHSYNFCVFCIVALYAMATLVIIVAKLNEAAEGVILVIIIGNHFLKIIYLILKSKIGLYNQRDKIMWNYGI